MKATLIAATLSAALTAAIILVFTNGPFPRNLATRENESTKYELHEFKDRDFSGIAGTSNHQLFKINKFTGQVWRLTEAQLPTGNKTNTGKTLNVTIEGWDEIEAFPDVWGRETVRLGYSGAMPSVSPSPQ